ncbi:MAG: cystathionine beta-synthase [Defluviicoccus sp.]|nr:cystathionine beta-synthase [Defluviicoccus sp.]MDG4593542.1 cystathionine beta-synthase [Defluviicoccus sp.]MDS4012113.1 cystathionine beta-synthase [Defluviicoccus sp.]MDS4072441.1 cystathionine beta-synthase [Defluviicoccus sp.]
MPAEIAVHPSPTKAFPATDVLDLIGNTPMVPVTSMDTGPCQLFLKLESQNPGGSIKDRIALSMIEAAEREGRLRPGGTLVEATAGNTGLGLALVSARKGYRLVLVIPDKMSREKIFHLRALGADVVMTRSDVAKGHPDYYQDKAEQLARETPGAVYVNQFENTANPHAHERGTGPEILKQMGGDLDAIVCGVGSGGTITGLSRFFAAALPHVAFVLADPKGSILREYVETGHWGAAGSWLVEGIGEDFVPPIADLSGVSEAYTIDDTESFATAREVLRREGILCGSSSGTLIAAALRYCRAQTTPKRVVTFVCDSGNKYLSKMFNDFWMLDHGFLARERHNDLRDIIPRRHDDGATITVSPDDTLKVAYARMKLYDVSQLPVLDGGRVVGILDETDLLVAVYGDQRRFAEPVRSAMTSAVHTLPPSAPVGDLVPIFERGWVAVVAEGDRLLGVITRIDLINHLRQKVD